MGLDTLRFRVLGPVEVLAAGRTISTTSRERIVLAALLLRANTVMSRHELVDTVWEDGLPLRPDAALQTTARGEARDVAAAVRTPQCGLA